MRKPAVCFVLPVLCPDLLQYVFSFLVQVYDYELNQHIIKSAHLAYIPLNSVVFKGREYEKKEKKKGRREGREKGRKGERKEGKKSKEVVKSQSQ